MLVYDPVCITFLVSSVWIVDCWCVFISPRRSFFFALFKRLNTSFRSITYQHSGKHTHKSGMLSGYPRNIPGNVSDVSLSIMRNVIAFLLDVTVVFVTCKTCKCIIAYRYLYIRHTSHISCFPFSDEQDMYCIDRYGGARLCMYIYSYK